MAIDSIRPKPAVAPTKRNQKERQRKQAPYAENKSGDKKDQQKQGIIDERV